ncbi:hypothetical protein [Ochrobactrum sp. BTU1]|uniref:hypothetical protein n=1 Tax=Ochrobactrum sp. BTU1 TaxID=2840456 RepID=UPI001C053063|nr:hypothetical protein KMS41_06950 [Ochrobactrum sp. BTU1]
MTLIKAYGQLGDNYTNFGNDLDGGFMLRLIAQAVLWLSGLIAAVFVAKDEPNFPLWQMTFGLLMLVVLSLAIWWFTNPRTPRK